MKAPLRYPPPADAWKIMAGLTKEEDMSDIATTLAERHETHGDFAENARIAQHLREFYRSCPGWHSLSEVQKEVLDANIGKDSRILSGNPNEPDHWRDKAGYSTLGFNWLTGGTL